MDLDVDGHAKWLPEPANPPCVSGNGPSRPWSSADPVARRRSQRAHRARRRIPHSPPLHRRGSDVHRTRQHHHLLAVRATRLRPRHERRGILRTLRLLARRSVTRPPASNVRFAGLNDIATQYGKLGGAAQRRFAPTHGGPGAILHHVTLAYDIDAEKMTRVLNISREKMSDKAVKSAAKHVDPMRSQTGMGRDEVVARLVDAAVRVTM